MVKENLIKQRFYSLDVFRGATVCLMIMVNNPGSWEHIYTPLDHSAWHGVTPTDLVFPFFLFAVGNALAFVMPRLEAAGPSVFWKKIIKRTLLIFLIGLMLNWMPFIKWENDHLVFKPWIYIDAFGQPAGVRILGVLQRIALAYFFASVIIYLFKFRGAFLAACVILLGYWFLCVAANPSDPFTLSGWFGTSVDKSILGEGHMYHGEIRNGHPVVFDPEGFMSLFGSIVQVIFGYFVGDYIIKKGKTPEMINGLFVAGAVFLFAGYAWDMVFPMNKKIWTSSYTVFTTGLAMTILAVMIYLIELKNQKGWLSRFFDVFGKNPLFIFVLSGFLPRALGLIRISSSTDAQGKQLYLTPFAWFYEHICKPIFPDNLNNGSLLYALCMITFYWLIVWWMDKKKIYVKV
ncbi:MAG: heparan-alpha-glucosaminide N-acetyltransferase domain-containing protein [Bacteroidota bacterium]|nr:heparan-alpha-glucosaminide N-acetyltransferase domain-containing protein [Bacteroidota bacterium]